MDRAVMSCYVCRERKDEGWIVTTMWWPTVNSPHGLLRPFSTFVCAACTQAAWPNDGAAVLRRILPDTANAEQVTKG